MTRIFIFVFLLLTTPPAFAQEATGTITASSSDQIDADAAVRMRDILTELGGYEDVTVTVIEGIVTLRGTANSQEEVEALESLAIRLEGVVTVKNEVVQTTDVGRRLDPAVDRLQARVDQTVGLLPLLLIAAAVFAIIVALGFLLARQKRPWDQLAPNSFVADIYRQIVRLAFVIFGIVMALDILDATALLSTILGAAGIIGLAIGFAVRDTVENFIASVMLSFRQPFRPNDTVEINGDQGKVIRLTSRATILLSFDGNHIRIPNSTVFKSRIINFSQNAERRFKFDILIDRNCDLGAARELMAKTVKDLPFVLATPEPQAWIDRLDPSGAMMTITGWINQHDTSTLLAQSEAIRQVKRALQDAGIGLVDSTQIIAMAPQDGSAPVANPSVTPVETADLSDVQATSEDALDALIKAERADDSAEDLLRKDSLKE